MEERARLTTVTLACEGAPFQRLLGRTIMMATRPARLSFPGFTSIGPLLARMNQDDGTMNVDK